MHDRVFRVKWSPVYSKNFQIPTNTTDQGESSPFWFLMPVFLQGRWLATFCRLTQINQSESAIYLGKTPCLPKRFSGWFGANFKQNGGLQWFIVWFSFLFSGGSEVNVCTMDEKIIRLCEENNVPSLVQALSTLKNQKVSSSWSDFIIFLNEGCLYSAVSLCSCKSAARRN